MFPLGGIKVQTKWQFKGTLFNLPKNKKNFACWYNTQKWY